MGYMSDLYEQKYLKYRRKYIELKNQLNGGASQNTLTKYDSNNSGLRNFLIKYGGALVPAVKKIIKIGNKIGILSSKYKILDHKKEKEIEIGEGEFKYIKDNILFNFDGKEYIHDSK